MAGVWGKLNLKAQKEIVVMNAPSSFEPEIKALDGVKVKRTPGGTGQTAFFLAFVTTKKEVDTLAKVVAKKTLPDAVVWFAYPKGSSKNYTSEISRDAGNEALGDAGFEPVRLVAIDDDWSAKRFRRAEFIKTMTRPEEWRFSKAGKSKK
jgi:hypothetical protein